MESVTYLLVCRKAELNRTQMIQLQSLSALLYVVYSRETISTVKIDIFLTLQKFASASL